MKKRTVAAVTGIALAVAYATAIFMITRMLDEAFNFTGLFDA